MTNNDERARAIASITQRQDYLAEAASLEEAEQRRALLDAWETFRAERPDVANSPERMAHLMAEDQKAVLAGDQTDYLTRYRAIADLADPQEPDAQLDLLAKPFASGNEAAGEMAVRFLRAGSIREEVPDGMIETGPGFLVSEAEDREATIARLAAERAPGAIQRALLGDGEDE